MHGDFGPNNVLLNPGTFEVTAVVDGEFAHLGDPVEDLAWCEWIVRTHHHRIALGHFFRADRKAARLCLAGPAGWSAGVTPVLLMQGITTGGGKSSPQPAPDDRTRILTVRAARSHLLQRVVDGSVGEHRWFGGRWRGREREGCGVLPDQAAPSAGRHACSRRLRPSCRPRRSGLRR
ncbi:phosphotransferase [Streptomyces capparidis]